MPCAVTKQNRLNIENCTNLSCDTTYAACIFKKIQIINSKILACMWNRIIKDLCGLFCIYAIFIQLCCLDCKDTITKAGLAPNNPSANDLWVDTIEKRLKLWNGTEWVNIGYEPTEPDPTDPDTPGGGENPDDPGGEGTDPENPGGDDPVDPGEGGEDNPEDPAPGNDDPGGDASGGETGTGGNEENPGGEEPSEEGGGS